MFLWLRRFYQAIFLIFFLFLVFVSTSLYIRGYDVQWFLEIDPLVALTTALSSHALHHTLVWALPLIVLLGRALTSKRREPPSTSEKQVPGK